MIRHGVKIFRYLCHTRITSLSYLQSSHWYSVHKMGLKSAAQPTVLSQQQLLINKPSMISLSTDIIDAPDLETTLTEVDEICDMGVEKVRHILYNNSLSSPELEKLNAVESTEELVSVLCSFNDQQIEQVPVICQTILVLWDLLISTYLIDDDDVTCREELPSSKQNELLADCSRLIQLDVMQNLLASLERNLTEMTPDELGCCFMYLNKMGLSHDDSLQQKIIDEFLKRVKCESEISLNALTRFVISTSQISNGVYKFFTCLDVVPHIYKHLDNCSTKENLCLVTIALNHIARLVPQDIIKKFELKVKEIILQDNTVVKSPPTPRIILKIVNLLNYPEWSDDYQILTRDLLLLLEPAIENLPKKELYLLQKNLKARLEPAIMIPKIVKRADQLLETKVSAELILCSLLEAGLPEKRVKFTELTKSLLANINIEKETELPLYFKVLRLLKTSSVELCNIYWDKVKEDVEKNSTDRFKLIRHLHRYMHFNNNLGGTYRHRVLEGTIIAQLLDDIENGITTLIPSAFARSVAFIIGYGSHLLTEDTIPELIIDKVEGMYEQFNLNECLKLSRGVQIAHELRYKFYIPKKEAPHLVRIEEVLNKCSKRHISAPNLNLRDLNLIVKAYNSLKSTKTHKSSLFQEMVSKYDTIGGEINSRSIRETSFNLIASNYSCIPLFQRFIDYTIENFNYISGDTLEKIVLSFYTLGYIPENEEFFKACHHIIERDFNFMSGLSIIQSCLALCFFKALSEDLIHKVFNISFIKRLEDEIEACYSKETYPERVLNNVMQLNRAVCLDVLAANVPWFQQNYIEAQMSKVPNIETKLTTDIKNALYKLVNNDESLVKINQVTPYGYRIEFTLYLDSNKKIIPPPPTDASLKHLIAKGVGIQRIALIPLKLESVCDNDPAIIRGFDALKQRHLEILGYKVVHINYRMWYSMFLSLPGARIKYLKQVLGVS